jgi:hypothetical protein
MSMKYRVNIDSANATKAGFGKLIDGKDARRLNRVGAFASLFWLDLSHYADPVLVLKTEEPGSKQVLAFQHDRVESVCVDMINHLINDCIVMGAEPPAVQDLIICGKLEQDTVTRIVAACADACSVQGCVLTGGRPRSNRISCLPGRIFSVRTLSGWSIAAGLLMGHALRKVMSWWRLHRPVRIRTVSHWFMTSCDRTCRWRRSRWEPAFSSMPSSHRTGVISAR